MAWRDVGVGRARRESAQSLQSLMTDRATGAEELRPYVLAHIAKTLRPHPWARACFRHVLHTARAQQAKALELRAAMSLNRLRQRRAKRNYGTRSTGGDPRLIPRDLWRSAPTKS